MKRINQRPWRSSANRLIRLAQQKNKHSYVFDERLTSACSNIPEIELENYDIRLLPRGEDYHLEPNEGLFTISCGMEIRAQYVSTRKEQD